VSVDNGTHDFHGEWFSTDVRYTREYELSDETENRGKSTGL